MKLTANLSLIFLDDEKKPRVSLKVKNEQGYVVDWLFCIPPNVGEDFRDRINAGAPFRRQGLLCKLLGHKPWKMVDHDNWCWTCFQKDKK